jgi:small conductance mechanosensitive channel
LHFEGAPVFLLTIWLGIIITSKIIEVLINWALRSWEEDIHFTKGLSHRHILRMPTLNVVLKGVSNTFLLLTGIVLSLQALQVPIGPVLAGAGLLGFAISFGSQNVIKDMISGALNLITDTYAVGDVVVIGSDSGTVESLNLLVTRIRNVNGALITIPNGSVGVVQNHTKDWSRVDYQIQVSYDADIKKALNVLQEVAQSLYDDPQWQKLILEPPDLKGIENLSSQGITLRIWLKTKPGQQWLVGRELRLRLKEAFGSASIEIGVPKQISINVTT